MSSIKCGHVGHDSEIEPTLKVMELFSATISVMLPSAVRICGVCAIAIAAAINYTRASAHHIST